MNINKFFEKAKEAGIESCQLSTYTAESTSIRLFHHEIDSYTVENDSSVVASGIYNGKYGSCSTEKLENSSIDFLIKGIIDSASISERTDCLSIFPGSEKYKKKNFFSQELADTPIKEKIQLIKDIENDLFACGDDVSEVESVEYGESSANIALYNSYGLKLKERKNYGVVSAGIVLKRGDETKTSGKVSFINTIKDFKKDEFVKEVYEEASKKFGGKQCPAKKYPTLLDRDVFGTLVSCFLDANNSIAIQKNSSFLVGMEGKVVASKKVSIDDVPLKKGPTYTYFDAEGVARHNQKIVNRGVLTTHFYNRETAAKANRETTGHASAGGGKLSVSQTNVVVKPSKTPKEDLIKNVKLGVYITDIAGLGTGLNAASGDFSCQAEGFMIRDGKIAEPLDLITLAGNLMQMLKDVKGLDNNFKDKIVGVSCSDALIKSMSIGGEN